MKTIQNKNLLDYLIKKSKGGVKKLTYIQLGIFLNDIKIEADWVSLGEAHDYLGEYENEEEDMEIKRAIINLDRSKIDKIIYSKLK